MKVVMHIAKRHFLILVGMMLLLASMFFAYAFNVGGLAAKFDKTKEQAAQFGHSSDEVVVDVPGTGKITLQEAITQGKLGGGSAPASTEPEKYYLETPKNNLRNSVPLDMAVVNRMCKDREGCKITLGMRDWTTANPGLSASVGPNVFFMSETSNWWRIAYGAAAVSSDKQGDDNNNVVEPIIEGYFDDCYLTDGVYSSGTGVDNEIGLHLLDWDQKYFSNKDKVCFVTIED